MAATDRQGHERDRPEPAWTRELPRTRISMSVRRRSASATSSSVKLFLNCFLLCGTSIASAMWSNNNSDGLYRLAKTLGHAPPGLGEDKERHGEATFDEIAGSTAHRRRRRHLG